MNRDVLEIIFGLLIQDDHVDDVWGNCAAVCQDWRAAVHRSRVKHLLIKRMLKLLDIERFVGWNKKEAEAVVWFDSIRQVRGLRHHLQSSIARVVALCRINGVPFPYLWLAEMFLDPKEWKNLFLGWLSPMDCLAFVRNNIIRLKNFEAVLTKPPVKVIWELERGESPYTTSIPVWHGLRPSSAWDVMMMMLYSWIPMATKLAIDRKLFWIEPDTKKAKAITMQEASLYVQHNCADCIMCGVEAQETTFEFYNINMRLHNTYRRRLKYYNKGRSYYISDLCSVCSRQLHQLLGRRGGDLTFMSIQNTKEPFQYLRDNHSIMCTAVDGTSLVCYSRDEVWFPSVEIECQEQCMTLVEPEYHGIQLPGLECIMRINPDKFAEQIRYVHAVSNSRTEISTPPVSSDEIFDLFDGEDEDSCASSQGESHDDDDSSD